jgi:putative tryptophan/tyrosine transport system substrate-binding protein
MQRREFITPLGGAAAAWPLVARAQPGAMPVIGFVYPGTPELSTEVAAAFRKGLGEAGFVEGRNVAVELRYAYGDNGRLPELMADLVQRRVAVIVTPGSTQAALAAKAATTSVPVVFSVGTDPVEIGLVASLSHPGGNVTGITSLNSELAAKRLGLMLELLPNAMRFAVLVNPSNRNAEALTRDAQAAASTIGRQVEILAASTPREIDAAFASAAKKLCDALVVSPEPLLDNRRVQLVTLAAHQRLPAIYAFRENVEIGGLMSYGSNAGERDRQVGLYAGRILKGEATTNLPVMRATKFEFVFNLQTARALGLDVPAILLAQADEVIE